MPQHSVGRKISKVLVLAWDVFIAFGVEVRVKYVLKLWNEIR